MLDTSLFGMTVTPFFSQFHFLRPEWLLAFVPMLLLLWMRWREESVPSWKAILPTHLRQVLTIGEHGWRKQLPLKLLVVNVTLAIIICAGPTWQRQASPFGEDKATLLVIMDNSDSMLQNDLPPQSLSTLKTENSRFVSRKKRRQHGVGGVCWLCACCDARNARQ